MLSATELHFGKKQVIDAAVDIMMHIVLARRAQCASRNPARQNKAKCPGAVETTAAAAAAEGSAKAS